MIDWLIDWTSSEYQATASHGKHSKLTFFCHSALQVAHLLGITREVEGVIFSRTYFPVGTKSAFRFFLTSVSIITWRQVNKVDIICVQGLTCVLFIDNIEHLYSSNTANLHIYFLLVWVIECLITGLKLKMGYLWLQSLMQSIDFKSYSATIVVAQ